MSGAVVIKYEPTVKLSSKQSQFVREARPWMVIAGVGSFIYCLLRFEDLLFALVGTVVGAISAAVVIYFHRRPRSTRQG
jgi:hypothetical protein